ncbi:hypothetical protein PKHYL_16450 [Psychrobacter sp. KH172YL61]|uniref:NAD(P)-binding protein n=1 Tax=Psychrobacter sp. KH172YL61 TaxID=2517899 RepID=UPI0010B08F40|nr:NAD(P)-binding protein [Psychrobacter sp. KH172YL61]BBI67454.1 hypothetical protein PKHYL_16450 [Psychrobacter sp. KH172YL61]
MLNKDVKPQSEPHFDFDQIIIGSGFGGSVSALRLSEKGNSVLVLEKDCAEKIRIFPKPT